MFLGLWRSLGTESPGQQRALLELSLGVGLPLVGRLRRGWGGAVGKGGKLFSLGQRWRR